MRYKVLFVVFIFFSGALKSQTPLTEAPDFSVKTTDSETIHLYNKLDQNQLVVIDFFSTSCGPCQTFAYDFELAYENFGSNSGNVFFVAINYNSDNEGVRIFDSTFNITLPSASGIEGGGNAVYEQYLISAYPTVIVITPDRQIVEQFVWEPTVENITNAVIAAGGILVGSPEMSSNGIDYKVFPIPADEKLNIQNFNTNEDLLFSLFDLRGSLQSQGSIDNADFLQTSDLPNGIYLLRLESASGFASKKIMIHHE